MFVILLEFSDNKNQASQYMQGHNDWLKNGFDDGIFLVAGSLQPGLGGAVIAQNCTRPEIESRVKDDPFVAENIVRAVIHEITLAKTDERLKFLLD